MDPFLEVCVRESNFHTDKTFQAKKMGSFETSDLRKIGIGLTGFGVLFTFFGVVSFFDKGWLAIGNIMFVLGVTLTVGIKSTMLFFLKRKNLKGSASFGAGFFLIMVGWPIIGMMVETYGFLVLFSGFGPSLSVFLQRLPIVGLFFRQPFVKSFFERGRPKRMPV